MALPETIMCEEHQKMMKLRVGKFGPQYSHVINYEAGEWCNKKPKDVGAVDDPNWIAKSGSDIKAEDTKSEYEVNQLAKDKKISRMHAQEMAIRWAEIEFKLGRFANKVVTLETIKELTDHFVQDAESTLSTEQAD